MPWIPISLSIESELEIAIAVTAWNTDMIAGGEDAIQALLINFTSYFQATGSYGAPFSIGLVMILRESQATCDNIRKGRQKNLTLSV